jgi:hypothetical protein
VLYCLLIFVLLKGRKSVFNSSFYSLFASTGIADLLMLCTRVFTMDLPSLFFGDEWLSLSNKLVCCQLIDKNIFCSGDLFIF